MPRKSTKNVAEPTEAKTEATETKTENIKAEETVAEAKKTRTKKAPAKRAGKAAKAVKEEAAAETAQEETAEPKAKRGRKAEVSCALQIQYAGRSYTVDELKKIAKDVWKYDLKQKVGDLKSVELYVKPEENKVYYVMNKEITGSFDI